MADIVGPLSGSTGARLRYVDQGNGTWAEQVALAGATAVVTAAPTVQAAAYASSNVIGGLLTLAGMARLSGGTGLLHMVSLFTKVANPPAIDVILFNSNPTASTFTDKAALTVAAADFDKIAGVAHVSDWTSLGASVSFGQATSLAIPFQLQAGQTTAYAALVARGAITFGSTGDIKLAAKILQD
jgi:hypothetical protein